MTDTASTDDEFTEMVDADFGRIDLVGKGANGRPFLVAKAAGDAGLIPAGLIEKLIDPAPAVVTKESDDVTIKGSPAAVMKMIHEAAQRQSSPNRPEEDTMPTAAPVRKADDPIDVGDLVPTTPGGSTAESVPGSPDWEEMDADTAGNVIAVLARAKGALSWLAGREATEAVTNGDDGVPTDVWDLEDSASQIDWIINKLAGFATREQLESDVCEEMADVGKQAAGLVVPVAVLEQWAPVAKAGKVLSAANEKAIRDAADSLQKVLSSLPAPTPDTVAKAGKEHDVNDTNTAPAAEATTEPVEKSTTAAAPAAAVEATVEPVEPVEKAAAASSDSGGKTPMVAVYDAKGNLVGTVDPDDLSPIASATPPDGGDTDPAAAAPAAADPLQPAPAAAAGAPAAVAKETAEPAKGSAEDVLKEMFASPSFEAVLKDHPVVKALQDEIAHLKAPAPSRVLSNGQLPPTHQMRGQDSGVATTEVDIAKADEMRGKLASATTVQEREDIAKQMNETAAAALAALQANARATRLRG